MNNPKPEKRAPRPRKRIARKQRPNKVRKTTLAALKRKLWCLFRVYVKDRDGYQCFTCDRGGLEGRNCHAGHLVTVDEAATAYDPENVHVQCARCNIFLKGNHAVYAERYIERYGYPKFQALMERSRRLRQWKAYEVEELIEALEKGGADYEMLYAEKYGL